MKPKDCCEENDPVLGLVMMAHCFAIYVYHLLF